MELPLAQTTLLLYLKIHGLTGQIAALGESRRGKGGGVEISTKHKGHWDFTTGSPFISILLRICFRVSAPN